MKEFMRVNTRGLVQSLSLVGVPTYYFRTMINTTLWLREAMETSKVAQRILADQLTIKINDSPSGC